MMWKTLAIAGAFGCVALLLLLARTQSTPRLNDPRLNGTWISDRERTLDALGPQTTDEVREMLEGIFGKLKVTYTDTTYTTELDDFVETIPYTVLGFDSHSVVIRNDLPMDPEMAVLELSTFSKVQFDGDDAYWVTSEFGGLTEYFKRVSNATPDRQ